MVVPKNQNRIEDIQAKLMAYSVNNKVTNSSLVKQVQIIDPNNLQVSLLDNILIL